MQVFSGGALILELAVRPTSRAGSSLTPLDAAKPRPESGEALAMVDRLAERFRLLRLVFTGNPPSMPAVWSPGSPGTRFWASVYG